MITHTCTMVPIQARTSSPSSSMLVCSSEQRQKQQQKHQRLFSDVSLTKKTTTTRSSSSSRTMPSTHFVMSLLLLLTMSSLLVSQPTKVVAFVPSPQAHHRALRWGTRHNPFVIESGIAQQQQQQQKTTTAVGATRAPSQGKGKRHAKGRKGKGKRLNRKSTSDPSYRLERKTIPNDVVPTKQLWNYRANQERLVGSIGCEHFQTCSGCLVDNHIGNVGIIDSAKSFFSSTAVRRQRFDVHPEDAVIESSDDGFYEVRVPSPLQGWRTQAKLVATPKGSSWSREGCTFGLYRRGTHEVMPIPNCQVHHPSINRAVKALEVATARVQTPAFEGDSLQGGLRYVQLQVERISGRICLTLVWNAEQLKHTQPALSHLEKALKEVEPDLWHSIWCHCNDGLGNNIFNRNPGRWHRQVGPEFLREPIPGAPYGQLYFTPLTFRQGNMDGFEVLARDVAAMIPGGSKVCELYAGVGLLGLTALCHHAERNNPLTWVRCSDENPANRKCFRRAMASL